MLTPQEVSERSFRTVSFGGYNLSQVDEFLDVLTADYTALYSENAVLKSKMKVLVEKVEEYRSTEEAMRKALMTAQRMADDLLKEAEQQKADILLEAEGEAARQKEAIAQELAAETFRLEQAKQSTRAFVEQVRTLYADQVSFLANLQDICPEEPEPVPVDPVEETATEIDDSVQRLLAQAMMDATAENLKVKDLDSVDSDFSDTAEFAPMGMDDDQDDDDDQVPVASGRGSRIDFGKLQFGRDYEIK